LPEVKVTGYEAVPIAGIVVGSVQAKVPSTSVVPPPGTEPMTVPGVRVELLSARVAAMEEPVGKRVIVGVAGFTRTLTVLDDELYSVRFVGVKVTLSESVPAMGVVVGAVQVNEPAVLADWPLKCDADKA
jgi:hypothetical protein